MTDRLAKLLWGLAVAVGLSAVGFGVSVFVEAWQTSRAWAGSAEALHTDVPAEAPIWLDQSPPGPQAPPQVSIPAATPGVAAPSASRVAGPAASLAVPAVGIASATSMATSTVVEAAQPVVDQPPATPLPQSLPGPGEIELAEADFRFLDPPEPGAHARIAVTLQNRADRPTGPLSLTLASRWLQSFQVFGAIPAVLDDRAGREGERQFVFGGLGPGERQTVELHVLATAEEVDAPEVRVLLSDGAEVALARPRTVAPRPRPGPARALAIPKLNVKAAVVPVPWEPPPFVIGQLLGTAALSEGNTVLIGHLNGPAGDVFQRLDRLRPGDEVVATSRGLEYRFVVSDISVRPYDDVLPTGPTTTPRLTMMTCTGSWSIARQDYTHRLWVVAEPPELARQTMQANAERAAQAAREAEAAAAARATHEAETQSVPPAEIADVPAEATPAPAAFVSEVERAAGGAELAAPAADAEMLAPGIAIDAPADGAGVPQRLVVRGRRTPEAPAGLPLWLAVRAEVPGSRWYALDRPLDVKPDGTWEAPIELGGAAGIRHEIRVGAVDALAEAALWLQAAHRSGQPLEDLPTGYQTGARTTVARQ